VYSTRNRSAILIENTKNLDQKLKMSWQSLLGVGSSFHLDGGFGTASLSKAPTRTTTQLEADSLRSKCAGCVSRFSLPPT
jgi:hypothetical protein